MLGGGNLSFDDNGRAETKKKKSKYVLSMFPYPSGALHMGHVRVYTISDCLARSSKMMGYDVLHPMGWDAFGLPAENAALERGVSPASWTRDNIAQMRAQLEALNFDFDWDEAEVTTCEPDYYRWTQWLFLQFYDAGLAYQKEALVNWDPVDNTVLANEQVDADGRSWRSGAVVEKKMLRQWFLGITHFADELLDGCKDGGDLDAGWPQEVRKMQANWIGKSHGARVRFGILRDGKHRVHGDDYVDVYTTRPDTLFGATFLALSLAHPLAKDACVSGENEVKLCSIEAVHPLTGKRLPVYVADYVVEGAGTDAVMGVPCHDERDREFAARVADGDDNDLMGCPVVDENGVLVNSGSFSGLHHLDGAAKIVEKLSCVGKGKMETSFRLRDWLVSRQRKWGTPIPIIHCAECGTVPVPESELPVRHDAVDAACSCPKCGGDAKREQDTLDTFVDSSWYFLRHCDAKNERNPFDADRVQRRMPQGVDVYIGGVEHAILHLLYARFVHKFLRSRGLVSSPEPFKRLLPQGMVLGLTAKCPSTGKYYMPEEWEVAAQQRGRILSTDAEVPLVWEKMSKSKYNGANPTDVVEKYGADVTRLAIMFKAPPEKALEWDEAGACTGQERFLRRVALLVERAASSKNGDDDSDQPDSESEIDSIRRATNLAVKKITKVLDGDGVPAFNVAIAELMKLSNVLGASYSSSEPHFIGGVNALVRMLAPFAPESADAMWTRLRVVLRSHCSEPDFAAASFANENVHDCPWPRVSETSPLSDAPSPLVIVVQMQGKRRAQGKVDASFIDAPEAELADAVQAAFPSTSKYFDGRVVSRTILVKPKVEGKPAIVNFVFDKK